MGYLTLHHVGVLCATAHELAALGRSSRRLWAFVDFTYFVDRFQHKLQALLVFSYQAIALSNRYLTITHGVWVVLDPPFVCSQTSKCVLVVTFVHSVLCDKNTSVYSLKTKMRPVFEKMLYIVISLRCLTAQLPTFPDQALLRSAVEYLVKARRLSCSSSKRPLRSRRECGAPLGQLCQLEEFRRRWKPTKNGMPGPPLLAVACLPSAYVLLTSRLSLHRPARLCYAKPPIASILQYTASYFNGSVVKPVLVPTLTW